MALQGSQNWWAASGRSFLLPYVSWVVSNLWITFIQVASKIYWKKHNFIDSSYSNAFSTKLGSQHFAMRTRIRWIFCELGYDEYCFCILSGRICIFQCLNTDFNLTCSVTSQNQPDNYSKTIFSDDGCLHFAGGVCTTASETCTRPLSSPWNRAYRLLLRSPALEQSTQERSGCWSAFSTQLIFPALMLNQWLVQVSACQRRSVGRRGS